MRATKGDGRATWDASGRCTWSESPQERRGDVKARVAASQKHPRTNGRQLARGGAATVKGPPLDVAQPLRPLLLPLPMLRPQPPPRPLAAAAADAATAARAAGQVPHSPTTAAAAGKLLDGSAADRPHGVTCNRRAVASQQHSRCAGSRPFLYLKFIFALVLDSTAQHHGLQPRRGLVDHACSWARWQRLVACCITKLLLWAPKVQQCGSLAYWGPCAVDVGAGPRADAAAACRSPAGTADARLACLCLVHQRATRCGREVRMQDGVDWEGRGRGEGGERAVKAGGGRAECAEREGRGRGECEERTGRRPGDETDKARTAGRVAVSATGRAQLEVRAQGNCGARRRARRRRA